MRKFLMILLVLSFAVSSFAAVGVKEDGLMVGTATDINFATGFDTSSDGSTVTVNNSGTQTITGGTINGAVIGGTSPAAGSFTTIGYSGLMTPGTSSGLKVVVELFTTGDTLTAAESGKTIALGPTGHNGSVFVLPAAASGLIFTFTSGLDATEYMYVDPASATDQILYSTCSVGDRIKSAGASGDSVTLVGTTGGYWFVTAMKGTWTDDD